MQTLGQLPPVRWALRHPRVSAWIVLSLGMILLLVNEARGIGLLPGQWIALIVACILVAGACIWIISWEDSGDSDSADAPADSPKREQDTPVSQK
jgi:hypothetical protein